MAQRSLEILATPRPPELAARAPVGRYAPEREVFFGDQPVEAYLRSSGFLETIDLKGFVHDVDASKFPLPAVTGRPPVHPRVFIGLVAHGLLLGISSLRKLEAMARADLRAMYLCGGNQPDHSTIGNFILENADYLTQDFFVEVTAGVARNAGLRGGITAIDGTVAQAVASAYKCVKAEAARERAEALRAEAAAAPGNAALAAKAEQADEVAKVAESRTLARAAHGRDPKTLTIAPTEPDAVVQPLKQGGIAPSYKPSIATHESGLIIAQKVHASSETAVFGGLVDQGTQVIGEKPTWVLSDSAYCNEPTFDAVLERDINLLVPSGKESSPEMKKVSRNGIFVKDDFIFDAAADVMRCPAGKLLPVLEHSSDSDGRAVTRYASDAETCAACPLKAKCITGKSGIRKVLRYAIDALKDEMKKKLAEPKARRIYNWRKVLVEGTLANLKVNQRIRRFSRFGLKKSSLEWALHCIAYNLGWAVRRMKRARLRRLSGRFPSSSARIGRSRTRWDLRIVSWPVPAMNVCSA
jgi:transposase